MLTEAQGEKQSSMGKLIFYAMIVSGVVAAYLMYRRGRIFSFDSDQDVAPIR